jgi:hypothetical protein
MLGRNDHGIDAGGHAIDVLNGDLALAVGPEPRQFARVPGLAKAARQLVRKHDGQGHELFGFRTGVTEHQALVARAAGVNAHGDIGALRLNDVEDAAGFGVKTHGRVSKPDVGNHLARQGGNVDIGLGRDLARDETDTGGDQNLTRNATGWVVRKDGVQNGVGNLVGHLIGMPFRYRLGSENMTNTICHEKASLQS